VCPTARFLLASDPQALIDENGDDVIKRSISGRPEIGEYSSDLNADIESMPGTDAVSVLEAVRDETVALFSSFDDAAVAGIVYAPGKWTIKDILQHLIDDERHYAVRALCIARGDRRPQAGFDENFYAAEAAAEQRTLADMLEEYLSVRASSVHLFASLAAETWMLRGTSNDHPVSVRGLAFHIAAHERHHLQVIRDRYVPLIA
jgi:hypothetical protein